MLAQAVTTNVQGNRQVAAPLEQDGGLVSTRIRDFIRMNPPEFFGSKADKDPQLYLDKVKKITQGHACF